MSKQFQSQKAAPAATSFTPVQSGMLHRKCACGGSAGLAGECEECSRKSLTNLRGPASLADFASSPSIASEMRGGTGSLPEANTLSAMQPGAGHDFGQVQVHAATPFRIQTKLTVGSPGDEHEEEADRVAEMVMRMPDEESAGEGGSPEEEADDEATLEIMKLICPDCTSDTVQAKEASGQLSEVTPELESQIQDVKAGGEPLPESVRAFFEPRFGYDFSNVRIHTDGAAAETSEQMNALAYTVGPHIVFGPGQYAPNSPAGKRLLAHELTHVVQQAPQAGNAQVQTRAARAHVSDGVRSPYETPALMHSIAPTKISKQASPDIIQRHTKAECDEAYDECSETCRRLPAGARRRRALCWAACMAAYATCLATSTEALTFAAIVAAIVLVAADGPFPIGDAAAAALLISLGIVGSSGSGS